MFSFRNPHWNSDEFQGREDVVDSLSYKVLMFALSAKLCVSV